MSLPVLPLEGVAVGDASVTAPSSSDVGSLAQNTSESTAGTEATLAGPVAQCVRALESAETDTEKLAALFLVPKLVKGAECDKTARIHIMKGIGYSFLARMLRSKDSPDGCSQKLMYQSVALSVLSCFANDHEIMTNASVLFNLPVILDIINDADDEVYEENLLIVNDAYEVLTAIASTPSGRKSFVSNRGIHYLCQAHLNQTFQCERALSLLLSLLRLAGPACWAYHTGPDDFDRLCTRLCADFAAAGDQDKFELCDTLRWVVGSFPRRSFDGEDWLNDLHKGLGQILFSKIGKKQRDPALKLVGTLIQVSDFDWCLSEEFVSGNPDHARFFLVLVNLASIEVIMQLEGRSLDDLVGDGGGDNLGDNSVGDNSDLLVACFCIVETAVTYLANERLGMLAEKQRQQLYSALKNGFQTVLKFLSEIKASGQLSAGDSSAARRQVVCATVRVLCAWLAEETTAMREDVYEVLPFVFAMARETFEAQRREKLDALPGRMRRGSEAVAGAGAEEGTGGAESDAAESSAGSVNGPNSTPDLLRFLLPGLCHLVTEDAARKILLEMNLGETLYAYLAYHWTVYDNCQAYLKELAQSEDEDSQEPSYLIDNAQFDTVNSRYALTTICNVLMNLAVLEPAMMAEKSVFFAALKFIMKVLPTLKNEGHTLVLYGTLSTLGLLIMKQHSSLVSSTDLSALKFIQSVVRFLWDAHNCEDAIGRRSAKDASAASAASAAPPADPELSLVSKAYFEHWTDLADLWFLSMQVLNGLVVETPWISEFVLDSGWPEEILCLFERLPGGSGGGGGGDLSALLPGGPAPALEDVLCSLIKSRGHAKQAREQLAAKHDLIRICQKHGLKDLATLVAGGGGGKAKK